jgi:hypothetical protein
MPCYEPLCCNANRKPIPLFSLYNSLNFPDSIAINYCAPSHTGGQVHALSTESLSWFCDLHSLLLTGENLKTRRDRHANNQNI